MSLLRRMAYMGLGGLLVLAVVVGAVAAFAQSGGQEETPAAQDNGAETGSQEEAATEDAVELALPGMRPRDFHGGPRVLGGADGELLAEALGITVEELEAAGETARNAAIDQALAEGLITEAQAEQLRERGLVRGFPGLGDRDELLAEALGISVEELQAAQAEARAARLAAMVEAGVLSQEEADMMLAREAVQQYIDREALAEMVQNAYEEAVAQALTDGAISQAQADQLLEALANRGDWGLRGFDGPFGGGRGHHRGFSGSPDDAFLPNGIAPVQSGTAGA